jgi:hypothetical protein
VIPFEAVKQGRVSEQQRALIKQRGCAVIKGISPASGRSLDAT